MLKQLFLLLLLAGFTPMLVNAQKPISTCPKSLEYENHNFLDPSPLSIRAVAGRIIDSGKAPVPNACLGLFTDRDHRLVASTVADDDGNFRFRNVPSGRYRLIVRDVYGLFCTVNAKVNIVDWLRGGIQMRRRNISPFIPPAIDVCRYVTYK